ncbi:MAG: hypothetical protein J4432_00910 [DPANN group archaeon]|nr:hypothetical protein [DPANN group archaeon]
MAVEFGEFKGNKIIKLKRDDQDPYPFSFGKNKAKLIVENFEDIKKFAEEAGTEEAGAE